MSRRILCCGSCNWYDVKSIRYALIQYLLIGDIIIHGNARGANRLCATEASRLGYKVESYPAN